ncbi:MAG: permease [Roseburia sp.]|nr:permease [Roseburia sp.]
MNIIQAVLILTGVCMVFFPKVLTKMQDREKDAVVKRTRNLGYWVFFAAIIWVVADYLIDIYL